MASGDEGIEGNRGAGYNTRWTDPAHKGEAAEVGVLSLEAEHDAHKLEMDEQKRRMEQERAAKLEIANTYDTIIADMISKFAVEASKRTDGGMINPGQDYRVALESSQGIPVDFKGKAWTQFDGTIGVRHPGLGSGMKTNNIILERGGNQYRVMLKVQDSGGADHYLSFGAEVGKVDGFKTVYGTESVPLETNGLVQPRINNPTELAEEAVGVKSVVDQSLLIVKTMLESGAKVTRT